MKWKSRLNGCAMENNIRELRKQLKLTQEDLALRLHVTRQTINAIENNKYNPTLELAMKLARLLETPVEAIFKLGDQDVGGNGQPR